jgi:hypothetical protein
MRKVVLLGLVALIGVLAVSTVALADRGKGKHDATNFSARLNGWEEDPSQVTTGKGSFRAWVISPTLIGFKLSYQGLEGPAFMAHIHIGSRHESGGISAWLCGASATPETTCPPGPAGELEGTIQASDITGPTGQGVEAGNFADLLRAMRRGETYTNVHTTGRAPGGEIRGQNRGQKHDKDD